MIRLNKNFSLDGYDIESMPTRAKVETALHEIGHTLGFAHTGDYDHISGTRKNDYLSIMDLVDDLDHATDYLHPDDIKSAQILYPD